MHQANLAMFLNSSDKRFKGLKDVGWDLSIVFPALWQSANYLLIYRNDSNGQRALGVNYRRII